MIRVAIVEDDPLIRAGVAAVLGAQPDLEVAGQAADGDAAIGSPPPPLPPVNGGIRLPADVVRPNATSVTVVPSVPSACT